MEAVIYTITYEIPCFLPRQVSAITDKDSKACTLLFTEHGPGHWNQEAPISTSINCLKLGIFGSSNLPGCHSLADM